MGDSAANDASPPARGGGADNEDHRLRLAVEMAVQLVDGCDHASITAVDGTDLVTRAASDPTAEQADRTQHELGEGPAADSVRSRGTVVSQDLRLDERWPRWAEQAHRELGIASTASLALTAQDGLHGSLNLYGARRHGLVSTGLSTAQTLVDRLVVALAAGRESDELNAVGTRTVIGQAEGILMERLGIDGATAYAYLRRAAEHGDIKVAQVAIELVRTRELPMEPPE